MTNNTITKPSFWSRRLILGTTVSGAIIFFIVGIIFWGGFNTAMEATNTTEFCIGCHEMEDNVYQEYTPTIHYSNRTGVRAGCPDCHVPRPWIHKVVRKIKASREVYFWLTGKIDTKEKFNEHRFELAQNVWKAMKDTDSRECRNCHNFESMNPEFQKPRARKQHLNAFETGQTCIDCHKGIAHHNVRDKLSDEALEKLEAPNPEYIREVPQEYRDGLARVEAKEAEISAQIKAEKLAEKTKVDEKIAAAVAAAVASSGGSEKALSTSSATESTKASNINVDWSKAKSTDIGVFYPGTASLEWILGRKHGGKRAFTKGDRCIECHGEEIADIGQNIVSGESEKDLEPNVIPGKRGSFDVTIDATHDAENLYLRFSWADGEHAAVPFVDGGKMDPENPMKLAFMLATDDVEYADRAGCWGTCHADANSMPFAPEQAVLKGSDLAERLNLNTGSGVTKYLTETRTKLELKGRGGKALGGWDKLKDEASVKAAQDADQFMDIVRYKSGTGEVEDGQILASRDMHGGQGAEVEASLKNGTWSVVVKRKLKSDKAGDVSVEAGKVYNFGFAIHDDYSSARYHHVSFGYKLALDNDEAEVNAVAQ